jgi:6,7-dimethyl-8-ribityllumazine synthase
MLKPTKVKSAGKAHGSFAIIASQYNARYVDSMLAAAKAELKRSGAMRVQIIRVPGAYEIPVVAARLAHESSSQALPLAIICLGVILRGETTHASHIGEAVSQALIQIQVKYEVPVIHEVLLLENESQARVRCLGRKHNRGAEAAHTAIAMAEILRGVLSLSERGSF